MAIPGLPGGFIIYQGHLFALKGQLWLQPLEQPMPSLTRRRPIFPAPSSVVAFGDVDSPLFREAPKPRVPVSPRDSFAGTSVGRVKKWCSFHLEGPGMCHVVGDLGA